MKISEYNSQTNFGWSYKTHQKITEMLVEKSPKLRDYKALLSKSVIMPDFDERGFEGNNHFYYPPMLFRPRESFLDFFGNNNALAQYTKHVVNFSDFVNWDREEAISHAGRALHFLQDVTQPQHVERGTVLKKWRDFDTHKNFEAYALKNEDRFINNAEKASVDLNNSQDFFDLFYKAISLTESIQVPNKSNSKLWGDIAQEGLSNAIAVTKAFLKNISDKL